MDVSLNELVWQLGIVLIVFVLTSYILSDKLFASKSNL